MYWFLYILSDNRLVNLDRIYIGKIWHIYVNRDGKCTRKYTKLFRDKRIYVRDIFPFTKHSWCLVWIFVGPANRKSWPTYLLRNFYCAEFLLYRSPYLIMEYYQSIDSLSHFLLRISRTKKERYTLTLVRLRCAWVQPPATWCKVMSARFGRNALFQALNYANDPYFLKRRSSKALMTQHSRSHEKSIRRRFITLRTRYR